MLNQKLKVKQETTVDKVRKGRSKSTERANRGRLSDTKDVSLVLSPSVRQSGSDTKTMNTRLTARSVPVFHEGQPLTTNIKEFRGL